MSVVLRLGINPPPISAGVLKNQDMLGWGVNLPPPPLNPMFDMTHMTNMTNMTNDTSLESSCSLLLESAKKIANLQKLNFLSQNPVI